MLNQCWSESFHVFPQAWLALLELGRRLWARVSPVRWVGSCELRSSLSKTDISSHSLWRIFFRDGRWVAKVLHLEWICFLQSRGATVNCNLVCSTHDSCNLGFGTVTENLPDHQKKQVGANPRSKAAKSSFFYTVSILQSSTTQTVRLSFTTRRLQREGHAEDGLCLTCWRCVRYMNHVLKRSWSQQSHCNRKELVRAQLSCACRRFQCHGAEHRFSGHCGRHESPAPIGQLHRPRGQWELAPELGCVCFQIPGLGHLLVSENTEYGKQRRGGHLVSTARESFPRCG